MFKLVAGEKFRELNNSISDRIKEVEEARFETEEKAWEFIASTFGSGVLGSSKLGFTIKEELVE